MYLYSRIHKNNNLFKFIEDRRRKRERERERVRKESAIEMLKV